MDNVNTVSAVKIKRILILDRQSILGEDGFSLIELLYCISIIGILSVLSWGAFYVYKANAEYSKAVTTLRNAKLGLQQGELEAAPGLNVGMSWTDTNGGVVGGDLATIMPGATTSVDVRVGAMYNACEGGGVGIWQMAVSQPCKGTKYVRWTKLCDGTVFNEENLAKDYVCP